MAFAGGIQNNSALLKHRFSFPLLVSLGALAFYVATLSWGVTDGSLLFTAKVAGWDWQPMTGRPLAWLLTLPLKFLPAGWIPAALNIFSALTAALLLGILARTVQLLTWDCPPNSNKIWSLRLPALLACAVCGLEYNFWRDATAFSGEMLEGLLFVAAVGCLFEFRAKNNLCWLDAAVVIWGVGLVENWMMQLLLPVFLAVLAWLLGWAQIGKPFLRRLLLLAAVAAISFSVQPTVNGLLPHSPLTLGESWLAAGHAEKIVLRTLYYGFFSSHRLLTVTVLLYFMVPVLACLVRIRNESATNIFGVERMQIWIFRILRVGWLLACLWLAFDPEVGPRKIILNQLKLAMPLLGFDYLLGLGAAFLLGSLLYAAQVAPSERPFTSLEKFSDWLRRHAFGLLAIFSGLAVTLLAARSAPGIFQARQASLPVGGELVARSLPEAGGIVLADDAALLLTLQAALAQQHAAQRWQLVDLNSLPDARYRAALEQKFPAGWSRNATQDLSPAGTLQLLEQLKLRHRIFYLLPEPGHFLFEHFYPEPQGAVHELKPLPENHFSVPALTAGQIAANETFWDAAWKDNLSAVSERVSAKSFPSHFAVKPVRPEAAEQLGRAFSIALNNWGVELQRNGKLTEAKHRFEQAQALNPGNAAPEVNLLVNSNLLAGRVMDLSGASSLARNVSSVQQLARIMEACGIFDEAVICSLLADACYGTGWPRQALQQLDRARTLAPDSFVPPLAMARIYSHYGMSAEVFKLVNQLRGFETNGPSGRLLGVELAVLEAKAWLDQTNLPAANRVLETVLQKNADDPTAWQSILKAYLSFGSPTNALALLDRMLVKDPDNVVALNNQAALLVQLNRATEALPLLDHALTLTNLPAILLNRAIALVQAQRLAEAEAAYVELQTAPVDQFSVQFGFAQIAEARHDTNAAVKQYLNCLTNLPPDSLKARQVRARLDLLQTPPAR